MLHLADGAQVGLEALLPEPGGELPVTSIHRAQVLQVICQRLPALSTACVMLRAPQLFSMCRPAFVRVFPGQRRVCLSFLALTYASLILQTCTAELYMYAAHPSGPQSADYHWPRFSGRVVV